MPTSKRILLTGGGTGGHIIPNFAIASVLKALDPSVTLLIVGTRGSLDSQLLEKAGWPFVLIWAGKWRRYASWQNLLAPFLVAAGCVQAFFYMIRFWPDAVFSKGGFAGLPVAVAAWILRRPLILHESDSVMGLANRWTAHLAARVCAAFPEVLPPAPKGMLTGNPVRAGLTEGSREEGFRLTGFTPEKPVLLVWGGSQGAAEVNALIVQHFDRLKAIFQIIHITGTGKATPLKDPAYVQLEYASAELPHLYAIADLAVSRAGANSLAELALLEKPAILIPLASAAHDHQRRNAAYYAEHGAARVLADPDRLPEELEALWNDPAARGAMRQSLKQLSAPDAAHTIAQLLLHLS